MSKLTEAANDYYLRYIEKQAVLDKIRVLQVELALVTRKLQSERTIIYNVIGDDLEPVVIVIGDEAVVIQHYSHDDDANIGAYTDISVVEVTK